MEKRQISYEIKNDTKVDAILNAICGTSIGANINEAQAGWRNNA